MKAALELLSVDPEIAEAKIDVSKTFDVRFISQVPVK
jgi:hypothetical protein